MAQGAGDNNKRKLWLIIAVSIAPVLLSYLAFYVFPRGKTTNYGALIEPMRPVPAMQVTDLQGAASSLEPIRQRWVMLAVTRQGCDARCEALLFEMRQYRVMTGRDRERIERALLVLDQSKVSAEQLKPFEGTYVWRAPATAVLPWLTLPNQSDAIEAHIYVIDPLGNLMLRFPANAQPNAVKKDLQRLLKTSGWAEPRKAAD